MHQRPPAEPGLYSEGDIPGSTTAVPATMADAAHGVLAQQRPTTTLVLHEPTEVMDTAAVTQGGYHGDSADDGVSGGAVGLLDDIFGEADSGDDNRDAAGTAAHPPRTTPSAAHPSDMNRLRHDHSTAGYREGLTEAKAASVQAGFDEGYGLGAALGREVGELLGLLEGLAAAAATGEGSSSSSSSSSSEHDESMGALLARARQQLTVAAVFGPAYFAADGTWLYETSAAAGQASDEEPTVFDVAKAHPLVRTWRGIVDAQLRRFGMRWGDAGAEAELAASLGLQGEDDDEDEAAEGRGPSATAATATSARVPPAGTTALDW